VKLNGDVKPQMYSFLKKIGINNDVTEKNDDHLHEPIRDQVLQRQCVTTVVKR